MALASSSQEEFIFLEEVKVLCAGHAGSRLSWHAYFGSLALLAAARSPCERLHVGCVLVRENRVLSMGYNGFFSGAPHESIVDNGHEQATVHAEQNAIAHAARTGVAVEKAHAYVTHYPCVNCFKSLVAAGVTKVYYVDDYRNDDVVATLSRYAKVPLHKLSQQQPLRN